MPPLWGSVPYGGKGRRRGPRRGERSGRPYWSSLVFEDAFPEPLRDLRDERVSEGPKSVHPSGNPISHSTHVGSVPSFQALAFGVGHFVTAVAKPSPLVGLAPLRLWLPFTVGVGHTCTAVSRRWFGSPASISFALGPFAIDALGVGHFVTKSISVSPAWIPVGGGLFRFAVELRACFESPAVGVGVRNKPEPVPPVRGAEGGSRYAVPLRVIPARGQVPDNSAKSSSKESCDVFHDDVAGS
jgi:hypothetical protein